MSRKPTGIFAAYALINQAKIPTLAIKNRGEEPYLTGAKSKPIAKSKIAKLSKCVHWDHIFQLLLSNRHLSCALTSGLTGVNVWLENTD